MARKLIRQTFIGSVKLLGNSMEHAAELRKRVTSKAGTTEAAMEVFEENQIRKVFTEALRAAKHRAKELSK